MEFRRKYRVEEFKLVFIKQEYVVVYTHSIIKRKFQTQLLFQHVWIHTNISER